MPNGRVIGSELWHIRHLLPIYGEKWCPSRPAQGPSTWFLNEFQGYGTSEALPALTLSNSFLIDEDLDEDEDEGEEASSASPSTPHVSPLPHVRGGSHLAGDMRHMRATPAYPSSSSARLYSSNNRTLHPPTQYLQPSTQELTYSQPSFDMSISTNFGETECHSSPGSARLGEIHHPSDTSGASPTSPYYNQQQPGPSSNAVMFDAMQPLILPHAQQWQHHNLTRPNLVAAENSYEMWTNLMDFSLANPILSASPLTSDYDSFFPYDMLFSQRFNSEPHSSWGMTPADCTAPDMIPVGGTNSGPLPHSDTFTHHPSSLCNPGSPSSLEGFFASPFSGSSSSLVSSAEPFNQALSLYEQAAPHSRQNFPHPDNLSLPYDLSATSVLYDTPHLVPDYNDSSSLASTQQVTPSEDSLHSFPNVYTDNDGIFHMDGVNYDING